MQYHMLEHSSQDVLASNDVKEIEDIRLAVF